MFTSSQHFTSPSDIKMNWKREYNLLRISYSIWRLKRLEMIISKFALHIWILVHEPHNISNLAIPSMALFLDPLVALPLKPFQAWSSLLLIKILVLGRGTIAVVQKKLRQEFGASSFISYSVTRCTTACLRVWEAYHLPGLGIKSELFICLCYRDEG